MIIKRNNKMLHRLIITCHENDKMQAYALEQKLTGTVDMSLVKELNMPKDYDLFFRSFTVASDIVVAFMTHKTYSFMSNILSQYNELIRKRVLILFPVVMGDEIDKFDFFTPLPLISSSGDFNELSDKVADAIKNYLHVNLGELQVFEFENLVKSVLVNYGFKNIVLTYSDHVDFGYDMMCSYRRGSDENSVNEDWLVEIKYISVDRFTIRNIQDLINQDREHYLANHKVMLVTNGTLTSAIWDYLIELKKRRNLSLFIVDGWKLSNLIALNDNLVKEYFPYE
jgi:hypothetical protein